MSHSTGQHSTWRLALLGAMITASFAALAPPAAHAAGPFQYFAVTPCRVVDTRNPNGTNGGPALTENAGSGVTRSFQVQGNCGVPSGAKAVTINVTIVSPNLSTSGGFASVFPSGGNIPAVSTINFTNTDAALANGAIVPLSTNTTDLSVFFNAYNLGSGTVHLVLDITGYFQ
jgi:hypothetical protein